MSRLVTNAIRSTAASSDAMTIDSAGKPSFPNGGVGKILQVVSTTKTDTASQASVAAGAKWSNTDFKVTITPSSASSKLLIPIVKVYILIIIMIAINFCIITLNI